MNSAYEAYAEYQASGIWTMNSARSSCVTPERPLLITEDEKYSLDTLAKGVWAGFVALTGYMRGNDQLIWNTIHNPARGTSGCFAEGPTMPPAIRVDVVRTSDGPKIVEADPVSARSLGETAFLASMWRQAGFSTLSSPTPLIIEAARKKGVDAMEINLPKRQSSYRAEQQYLASELTTMGLPTELSLKGTIAPLEFVFYKRIDLCAFVDDDKTRRILEAIGYPFPINPLWGPMAGVDNKWNLGLLRLSGGANILACLPKEYDRSALGSLDKECLVVCKPVEGTGSQGVQALPALAALELEGNWIFQELLQPLRDDYGRCIAADRQVIEGQDWVTRLSIYAGEHGVVGAQATARRSDGDFTNSHGQRDAVQSAVAVK